MQTWTDKAPHVSAKPCRQIKALSLPKGHGKHRGLRCVSGVLAGVRGRSDNVLSFCCPSVPSSELLPMAVPSPQHLGEQQEVSPECPQAVPGVPPGCPSCAVTCAPSPPCSCGAAGDPVGQELRAPSDNRN